MFLGRERSFGSAPGRCVHRFAPGDSCKHSTDLHGQAQGPKGQEQEQKAKKAQIPLGPGGTLSKKQKMKANKYAVASFLQQKKAHGADYKKMRAHGQAKNWKKFAEEVKKAWNGTPETLFFLQNSMTAREVFMAVFKGGRQPQAPARRPGDP